MKKIFIVILHFGKITTTKSCIASLEKYEKFPYKLIVVNNTQDTLSAKDFSLRNIIVINNSENKGFAGGVNVGIKKALSQGVDAVLLLNNDTKISKSFLEKLIETLYAKKEIGIVGPAIEFIKNGKKVFDIGGYINWFGKTFHEEVGTLKGKNFHEVEYVTGAAMLIKKEVFKKELFNEEYFLYYEDVDFCLRARENGFKIFVDPEVVISHLLSKTAGRMSPLAFKHQTRSAVIFGRRYMKGIFQKTAHFLFLLSQSTLFTLKYPKAALSAWKALLTTSRTMQAMVFVFLVLILVYASYWQIFSFTFWKDDWSLLWSTIYNLKGYHGYFNHPGTPVEFFLLTKTFGLNPFFWMCLGFLLRVVNAICVGLFAQKLVGSKKVGFISGLFFAASYAGGESLHFISGQVTALALIPLCFTGIYFIKLLEEKTLYLYYFLFWILIAFLIDPPRTVPVIFLLPLLALFKYHSRNYKFVMKILKKFYVYFAFLGIPLFIFWFIVLSPGTLLGKLFLKLPHDPKIVFSKWYELHHLAATIGNLFVGWIYRMRQDDQNTGIYARQFAVLGYGFLVVGVGSLIAFLKTKKSALGILAFTIFWTLLFYFPNWLSEPRAPMASSHRYLLIPSVGFIMLVAYLIVQLKNKIVFIICTVLFILLNIYQSNVILAYQSTYRSEKVVTKIWNQLSLAVPKGQEYDSIWMVSGKEPWVSEDVLLSGSAPFALQRKLIDSNRFPMMTNNPLIAMQFLCRDNLPQINRWNVVLQKERIHLSHIYAWRIEDKGKVVDVSLQRRKELIDLAKGWKCTPIP